MTLEYREWGGRERPVLVACPYCGQSFEGETERGGQAPSHLRQCDAVPSTAEVEEALR